jgi:hypothetical protein
MQLSVTAYSYGIRVQVRFYSRKSEDIGWNEQGKFLMDPQVWDVLKTLLFLGHRAKPEHDLLIEDHVRPKEQR